MLKHSACCSSESREAAGEATREASTALELETASSTLLEHEPLASSTTEGRALEGVSSLSARRVVGIVALVEALPELWV